MSLGVNGWLMRVSEHLPNNQILASDEMQIHALTAALA
jgi:hypothetical protein